MSGQPMPSTDMLSCNVAVILLSVALLMDVYSDEAGWKAEDCALHCYDTRRLNARCDNVDCLCDDDCFRHMRLHPWSDPNVACLKLCLRSNGTVGRCQDGGSCECSSTNATSTT